jgi:hypothetical protein
MKKPRQSKLDPLKIYMNAERFRLADNYLRSSANPDIEFRQIIGLPALVICAFAAELYLKCLLCIETGNAPATHNLKALFRDLGHTTRFRVENLWKERLPLQAGTFEIMERVTGRAPPRDFASALDAGAQAFVDLRYLHETGGMGMSFVLGEFPTMLRIVILEAKPEWAAVRHPPPTVHTR